MSKVEILELWQEGMKQVDIADKLGVGESYVSQVLAPHKLKPFNLSNVSPEIKRLFERLNRNLEKIWGYNNKTGKEKNRPKYRNLWEDWESFSEWFKTQ